MAERATRKAVYLQLTEWEDERLRIKAQTLRMTLRDLIMKAVDAYAPNPAQRGDSIRIDSLEAQLGEQNVRVDSVEAQLRALRDLVEMKLKGIR